MIAEIDPYITNVSKELFRQQEVVLHSTSNYLMDSMKHSQF